MSAVCVTKCGDVSYYLNQMKEYSLLLYAAEIQSLIALLYWCIPLKMHLATRNGSCIPSFVFCIVFHTNEQRNVQECMLMFVLPPLYIHVLQRNVLFPFSKSWARLFFHPSKLSHMFHVEFFLLCALNYSTFNSMTQSMRGDWYNSSLSSLLHLRDS